MNKVIYTVFALIDGKSCEIGNPFDCKDDASQFALEYFVSHGKKYPTKVVETKVSHKVVDLFTFFKVCVYARNKTYWFNSVLEYENFSKNLVKKHIPFTVSTFPYDC